MVPLRSLCACVALLAVASPLATLSPEPIPSADLRAPEASDAVGAPVAPVEYRESFSLRHAQTGVAGAAGALNCVELRSARGTIHTLGGTVRAQWSPLPVGFESMELVVAPLDGEPSRGWSNRALWRAVGAMELREDAPVRVFLQPYADEGPGAQPFELELAFVLTGGDVRAAPSSCSLG